MVAVELQCKSWQGSGQGRDQPEKKRSRTEAASYPRSRFFFTNRSVHVFALEVPRHLAIRSSHHLPTLLGIGQPKALRAKAPRGLLRRHQTLKNSRSLTASLLLKSRGQS
jgi:hypothetical protein